MFWGAKTPQNSVKFFGGLCHMYRKYILEKNWSKTTIPALSSGQTENDTPIWGRRHQLETMLKISCVTLRDYYIKYCLLHLQEENPQDRKVMRVRRCDGVPPSRWDPVSHWHSPGTFLTENSQSSFYVSTPGGRWVPDRGLSIVLDLKVVCS